MMGKAKGMLCLSVAVLAAGMTAWGQETGDRPSERIRFKKGEHPRIWITKTDLPGIRARCAAGGSHEREFKRLKALVDREMATREPGVEWRQSHDVFVDPVPVSFMYLVTGERKYAERTKKMLKVCPRGVERGRWAGVALDWIMAKCDLDREPGVPVTRAELAEIVAALIDPRYYPSRQLSMENYQGRYDYPYPSDFNPFHKPYQYRPSAMLYLALAVHDEGEEYAKYDGALDWVMRWTKETFIAATNRWGRGVHYFGFVHYHSYQFGEEARAAQAWKTATGEDLFPGSVQLREFARWGFYQREPYTREWVHFGVWGRGANADSIMPIYSHANSDPTVRALAQYVENRRLTEENLWNKPVEDAQTFRTTWDLWERILWYDPKAPEADLRTTPTAAYFPGNGYSSFHSGWGRNDTSLFFVAGDHPVDGQLVIQGHFEVFHKGQLTGLEQGRGGYNRTIKGNCLLVRDPEEIVWAGWNSRDMHPNDGGQYPFPAFHGGGDWRKRSKDDVYDVAETTAFASKPLFDYVAGDVTNAYRQELRDTFKPTNRKNKLSRCTRQIVFLKPDVVVVFDRVDSTNAAFAKTWLLHTAGEPTLEGSLYSAEAGQGKLMVRRLLPEQAGVQKLSGEALEAWAREGKWSADVVKLYRGSTGWRIEESPTEKRTDDVFLHVLYACDKGTPATAMPKCEAIGGANLTGAKVMYLGRTYEVAFRRDGGRACAGHIRIVEGGKEVVDEALAERVVPTFEVTPPMPELK